MKKIFILSFFRRSNKNTIPKLVSGFTLIELLMVITIIGIILVVSLAFLGSAKSKGNDSSVKSGMASMRNQAEMVYGANPSLGYKSVCTGKGSPEAIKFAAMFAQATSTGAGTSYCAGDMGAWSIFVKLKSGGYWCVGSSGASKVMPSMPSAPNQTTSCK